MTGPASADGTSKGALTGVLFVVAATTIWGLSPLFFAQLGAVPAGEVIAHRTLWSLPFILAYGAATGRRTRFLAVASDSVALRWLLLSAAAVVANWLLFVWSIQVGRTLESSFGYYIYPLTAVLLGAVVFGEPVSMLQRLALALAAMAVLWLGVRLGALPWIPLLIAGTFAIYGVVRKAMAVGPMIGVAWEMVLIAPFALFYLLWLGGGVFGQDARLSALLIGSAAFTALPLVLFVEAAKRLRYATVGVLFYINPTLQLVSAALLGEAVSGERLAAFAAIWLAVALYCADLLWRERRSRIRARAVSGHGSTS